MVIIRDLSEFNLNLPANFTGIVYTPYKIFKKNNKHHRYYGPTIKTSTNYKSWYFNNKKYGHFYEEYSQKQFLKDISKQWLL